MIRSSIVLAAALAIAAVTGASAQQVYVNKPAASWSNAQGAFAQAPARRAHSVNPAYDVYDAAGNYLGSDPDPLVRFNLLRDQGD
jgi:hypothetical protein